MLHPVAEGQQPDGHRRQLGAHLVIKQGKLRHHHGEQKDQQRDDQHHQKAGVNERGAQLFAEGERDPLEADVALQNFDQVARALAGQQRGGVHQRKSALRLEGRRERFARLHAGRHVVQLRRKQRIFLDLAQHLQRAEDGQPGADEGEKLLVEDEERLQLDLAPRQADSAAGADTEDVVTGMRKAGAQLLGRRRGLDLLLHAATLIGQFDDELCHVLARRSRAWARPAVHPNRVKKP